MQETFPTLKSIKPLKDEFKALTTIPINSDEFKIGRSLENCVVIAAIPISRKHCVIRKYPSNGWCIEDFSSGGIRINSIKLKKGIKHCLNHNDLIQLDVVGDFSYRFLLDEEYEPPPKRKKSEQDCIDGVIENVKQKFEESQSIEMENHKNRIASLQQTQNTNILMKKQLEKQMLQRQATMEKVLNEKIEQLKGEQEEVEKQKEELKRQHNDKLAKLTNETDTKINELQEKIDKHNEIEAKLLEENTGLKERLVKEREQFLEQLSKESESKQSMLEQLEQKLVLLEEERKKERAALEIALKKETEQLVLAKDKEVADLKARIEEERSKREAELEKAKDALKMSESASIEERTKAENEFKVAMERVNQAAMDDKVNMEKLMQEKTEKYTEMLNNLQEQLKQVQDNKEQYSEKMNTLQDELTKVRSELQLVENEKTFLIQNLEAASSNATTSTSHETVKLNVLSEFGQIVENELQCSICSELLICAMTLNCAHTFCKYCIDQWKKKKRDCPICRAPIASEIKNIVLDSFIDKMVENLTDDLKQRRLQVLKERQELVKETENREAQRECGGSSYTVYSSDEDDDIYEGEGEAEEYSTDDSARYRDEWYHRDRYRDYRGRYGDDTDFDDEYDDEEYDTDGDEYDDGDSGAVTGAHSGNTTATTAPDTATDTDNRSSVASTVDTATSASSNSSAHGVVVGSAESSSRSAGSSRSTESGGTTASNPHTHSSTRRRRRQHVEGLPGSYYGGYGRCFSCGNSGHWAPGCPFN